MDDRAVSGRRLVAAGRRRAPAWLAATVAAAVAMALAAAPAVTHADEMPARETAAVAAKGRYSVGVFNPLRLAVRDGVEVEAHPLVFLIAPHAVVRLPHVDRGRLRVTGEYGVSVPTLAMKLAQGDLFPSWYHEQERVGWIVAPRAGAVASVGDPERHVLTARVDLTVGIVLSHTDTTPPDTYAPVELWLAPATRGYRGRAGVIYDRRLAPRWRLRGYADLYLIGGGELHDRLQWPLGSAPDVITRAGAGVDVAVGARRTSRLVLGAAWWSYDQHAIDPRTFQHRRSNDVFPTIDFIWAN